MPDSTGEEELSPGPYQYQAPGMSGLYRNYPTELEAEGYHLRDYERYRYGAYYCRKKRKTSWKCYRIVNTVCHEDGNNVEQSATRSSHPTVSRWSLVTRSGRIMYSVYRRHSFLWKQRSQKRWFGCAYLIPHGAPTEMLTFQFLRKMGSTTASPLL